MTIPQPLDKIGKLARRVQTAGFSGLLFTETGRTAYLNAAVASQAARLGYLPRLRIEHTSASTIGQIYVPWINGVLMVMVLILVFAFRSSAALAYASAECEGGLP